MTLLRPPTHYFVVGYVFPVIKSYRYILLLDYLRRRVEWASADIYRLPLGFRDPKYTRMRWRLSLGRSPFSMISILSTRYSSYAITNKSIRLGGGGIILFGPIPQRRIYAVECLKRRLRSHSLFTADERAPFGSFLAEDTGAELVFLSTDPLEIRKYSCENFNCYKLQKGNELN